MERRRRERKGGRGWRRATDSGGECSVDGGVDGGGYGGRDSGEGVDGAEGSEGRGERQRGNEMAVERGKKVEEPAGSCYSIG